MDPERRALKEDVQAWLGPLLGLLLFGFALLVLRSELRSVSYPELAASLSALSLPHVLIALLLTALNYAVLTGYDQLAFAYVGKRLPPVRIALASFVAYAIANNVGFGMLSGASVRYRFYTRWGVGPGELSRIVLFYTTTFWLGLLLLGGLSLAAIPLPGREWARAAGILLLLVAAAYAAAPLRGRTPVRLFRLEIPIPPGRIVAMQFVLSALDWTLAAAVLYALLPGSGIAFAPFLGGYLAAQILGLLSHVPGGLGVFESAMVVLAKPHLAVGELLPALLLYRVVYYLLPLALALVILAADELRQRRPQAARLGALFGAAAAEITPRLLAVFTFGAGAVLLFSGATPAAPGRLQWLSALLPLPVVEISHFTGSVVGVCLLLLSWGIARRLDATYYLALGATALGLVASLLKGADYEEATLMGLLLVALAPSRARFDRKAAFFATRFSPGWTLAVLSVVGASVWLGLFSFKHVDYSHELWWQFESEMEASRFLRASVGVAVALLAFGVGRLLRPAPHEIVPPSDTDLADAERAIGTQAATLPYFVHLRDKAVLFSETRDAFIMYGVQGRTWVALGDPVGPAARAAGLIRDFLERCDDFDGTPVFYQVSKETLHDYADFGLTFVKLGEEARVPLADFTLEGGRGKPFRKVLHKLEADGASFRMIPAAEVPGLIAPLKEVSDQWLRGKATAEKGFSLGFFDPAYLARFPVAAIERTGRIQAFATVWPGPQREELSIDLMRYGETSLKNVMEALFLHLMLWGKEQGYRFFNLGMAPLSGLEVSPVAPLWARMGSFVYRRGEAFYNFQGLRAYKEKFHPVWEPRYLAHPGGLGLPRILADVAALIAGGYRSIFRQ